MRLPRKIKTEFEKEIWKEKSYQKVFYIMVTCIVITVMLFAVLTYYKIKKMVIDQNVVFAVQNFENACSLVESAEEVANNIATQLLLDDICDDVLFANNENELDSIVIKRVAKKLSLFQKVNEEVESIYLYNGKLECFVTSNGSSSFEIKKEKFEDDSIVEIIDNYENYKSKKFIKRVLEMPIREDYTKETEVYTVILDSFKGNTVYSAVVVNLSANKIHKNLLEKESIRRSYMAIYEENEVVLELENIPGITGELVQKKAREIQKNGEKYREFWENGKRYAAFRLTSKINGWNYVQVCQWNDVFTIQNNIRDTFLGLIFIIIALAIGISRACSMLIYRPFRKTEKEYYKLVNSAKKRYESQKEDFIYNFVNEKRVFQNIELKRLLKEYGFLTDGKRYTLAILTIDNYEELKKQFDEGDIYHIKYGFRNIFEEVCNGAFDVQGIIFRDGIILFLIGTDKISVHKEMKVIFSMFCEKEKLFLEWNFHMMCIEKYVLAEQLPELKKLMWTEITNLFFYEPNRLISYEELVRNHQMQLDYSQLKQKDIQEALYAGNVKEVELAYKKYKKVLEGCDAIHYRNALTCLAFLVAHIVDEYRNDIVLDGLESHHITSEKYLKILESCDTVYQADEVMRKFFEDALRVRERASLKSFVYNKMEDVKGFIQSNFKEPNLSQDYIADKFGVSSPYLGRQFRKYTGNSVAEYINVVRLNEVLRQLRETDCAIKDIAIRNGFEAVNYFYTYFKKKMGITPQSYREREKMVCKEKGEKNGC